MAVLNAVRGSRARLRAFGVAGSRKLDGMTGESAFARWLMSSRAGQRLFAWATGVVLDFLGFVGLSRVLARIAGRPVGERDLVGRFIAAGALVRLGAWREAAAHYLICLKLFPAFIPAYTALYVLLLDVGQVELARSVIAVAGQNVPGKINFAALSGSAGTLAERAMAPINASGVFLKQISSQQRRRLLDVIRERSNANDEQADQTAARASLIERLNCRLDAIYAIFSSVATVFKFNLLRMFRGNKALIYSTVGQTFFSIIGHYYLFYLISHPVPSELSILAYTMPSFSIYILFSHALHKSSSQEHTMLIFRGRRIGFISFVVSFMTLELMSVFIACLMCIVVLYIAGPLDVKYVSDSFRGANIPAFVGLMILSYAIGYSFGAVFYELSSFIPGMNSAFYVIMPVMFVTSGVYSSYNQTADLLKDIFQINPLLAIVEKGRESLMLGYTTPSLSLVYPMTAAFIGMSFVLMLKSRNERLAQ